MKKVVIFGGAGSIGLSLIKYLLSEGKYEITVVDLKNKENCIFDNIFILLSSDKIILSS